MIPGASILAAEYFAGFFLLPSTSLSSISLMIDLTNGFKKYYLKRNETARYFHDEVVFNNIPVDLTGAGIIFNMKISGGATVEFVGDSPDPTLGELRYQPVSGDLEVAGVYEAEWRITFPSGALLIWPTDSFRRLQILEDLA